MNDPQTTNNPWPVGSMEWQEFEWAKEDTVPQARWRDEGEESCG